MPSLEVVAGLLLIILFYSLLATVIMELISGFFSLRARHLERVLRGILSSQDKREEILDAFKAHPIYQQLAGRFTGKQSPPSYLGSTTFRSILLNVISTRDTGDTLAEKIDGLPDENLKKILRQLWEEAGHIRENFQDNIEKWYNDVMDRASGWYRRNTVKILLALGLIIAVVFNVDILTVYSRLVQSSQADLEQLTALAQTVAQQELAGARPDSLGLSPSPELVATNRDLLNMLSEDIRDLRNPLGIGWEEVAPTSNIFFWLFKVFGWLIMAICISKGAPFWFDLLKKIVNFRGAGQVPSAAPAAPTVVAVTPPAAPIESTTGKVEVIETPVG